MLYWAALPLCKQLTTTRLWKPQGKRTHKQIAKIGQRSAESFLLVVHCDGHSVRRPSAARSDTPQPRCVNKSHGCNFMEWIIIPFKVRVNWDINCAGLVLDARWWLYEVHAVMNRTALNRPKNNNYLKKISLNDHLQRLVARPMLFKVLGFN